MAADTNDYFKKVGPATVTTLSAPGKALAATSITVGSTTNFPTDTGIIIAIRVVGTDGELVAGTYTEWSATVTSSTSLSIVATPVYGSDQVYPAGSTTQVYIPTSSYAQNKLIDGLLVHTNQDGTLKTGAVDNAAVLASDVVETAKIKDSNVTEAKLTHRPSEYIFDHVASGCVWSGDSYGSTRAASMTSGVVYISGLRITVASVTARSFTASKDTYIDVDNTGTLVYTEVTNNAASPALAANSIRLGIIVTGASNIANVGSVNQGQFDKVLPIASSIAYSVTDSLGNLICPRDPQRKILGYRQIVTNFTTTNNTPTDITGLNFNCKPPTGRKVKVTGYIGSGSSSAINNAVLMQLYDVTAGAQLTQASGSTNASGDIAQVNPSALTTPSSATQNYKAQMQRGTNAATANSNGSSTNPNYIIAELV